MSALEKATTALAWKYHGPRAVFVGWPAMARAALEAIVEDVATALAGDWRWSNADDDAKDEYRVMAHRALGLLEDDTSREVAGAPAPSPNPDPERTV